jgi:hypothetical protein
MSLLSLQFLVLLVLMAVSARAPADRLSEGRPLAFVAFAVGSAPALVGASVLEGGEPATAAAVGGVQGLLIVLGTAVLGFARWRCRRLDAGRVPAPVPDEG